MLFSQCTELWCDSTTINGQCQARENQSSPACSMLHLLCHATSQQVVIDTYTVTLIFPGSEQMQPPKSLKSASQHLAPCNVHFLVT